MNRKGHGKRLETHFNQLSTTGIVLKITSNSFSDNEKLGVEGKRLPISDAYDDFYLLNIKKSNEIY